MIITLIIVGLLIIGITCLIFYNRNYKCPDWVLSLGIILTIIFSFASLFVGTGIVDNQVNKDIYYQNTLYKREMLEYRIDNMEEDIVGNEMLYNDIVEFNNELRSTKKWANNPWTNWFYNEDIATIDYVEIDGR